MTTDKAREIEFPSEEEIAYVMEESGFSRFDALAQLIALGVEGRGVGWLHNAIALALTTARHDALEEAAKAAEGFQSPIDPYRNDEAAMMVGASRGTTKSIAAAIRALNAPEESGDG